MGHVYLLLHNINRKTVVTLPWQPLSYSTVTLIQHLLSLRVDYCQHVREKVTFPIVLGPVTLLLCDYLC